MACQSLELDDKLEAALNTVIATLNRVKTEGNLYPKHAGVQKAVDDVLVPVIILLLQAERYRRRSKLRRFWYALANPNIFDGTLEELRQGLDWLDKELRTAFLEGMTKYTGKLNLSTNADIVG